MPSICAIRTWHEAGQKVVDVWLMLALFKNSFAFTRMSRSPIITSSLPGCCRARRPIVATHVLARRCLAGMNDVTVSARVVSRTFMQTHEVLNIRVFLVQNAPEKFEDAPEKFEESAISAGTILRSEVELQIYVAVGDVQRQK